jgi:hypothetical protein
MIDLLLEFIIVFAYIGGLIALVAGIFYAQEMHLNKENDQ